MLTKYIISIDGKEYELASSNVKNWDQIKCSFKRSDYGGVVRSFTSQFEFVGDVREHLMSLYLRHGFNAKSTIAVYTVNERWEWDKQFDCPLDFAQISWTPTSLSIGCVDTSVAALIKANKGTKYEFMVGTDITPDGQMQFDRLPLIEDVSYSFTGGETDERDGSLITAIPRNERIYIGVTSEANIVNNGAISYNDDQDDTANSYLLKAFKSVVVSVDIDVTYDSCYEGGDGSVTHEVCVLKPNGSSSTHTSFSIGNHGRKYVGTYAGVADLREAYPYEVITEGGKAHTEYWAVVDAVVWVVRTAQSLSTTAWHNTYMTESEFRRSRIVKSVKVSLGRGDCIYVKSTGATTARVYKSVLKFGWTSIGTSVTVDTFAPKAVVDAVLGKISDGAVILDADFSNLDTRLANTRIFAAESLRGIPTAKLYTSFNDFCEWMEVVFGYTYQIGEPAPSRFVDYAEALHPVSSTPYNIESIHWSAENTVAPTTAQIQYLAHYGKFVANNGTKWYGHFPGEDRYNDPTTGIGRRDTVFLMSFFDGSTTVEKLCYFEDGITPIQYKRTKDDIYKPVQTIHFLHRTELFGKGEQPRRIERVRDVQYSVDSSSIYSTVEIGYEKKDYDGICGRDEFNFCNTYSTGCAASDKTLTLKSRYRADSYGVEFAAQKYGDTTTDSTSDSDVFFALCTKESGLWHPDKSCAITNATSDKLFNGAFSPMACVRANAGLIGLQSDILTLTFASTTGNADIVVNGEKMNTSISLASPLATCGILQFSTDDIRVPSDISQLIEVEHDGILYRGYLAELDLKFAKSEAAKYQLIVKSIEL